MARSRPRQVITAGSSEEEVDLVIALGAVANAVIEHNRRVMTGEPANWAALATLLIAAGRSCQRHTDAGQAGHATTGDGE